MALFTKLISCLTLYGAHIGAQRWHGSTDAHTTADAAYTSANAFAYSKLLPTLLPTLSPMPMLLPMPLPMFSPMPLTMLLPMPTLLPMPLLMPLPNAFTHATADDAFTHTFAYAFSHTFAYAFSHATADAHATAYTFAKCFHPHHC